MSAIETHAELIAAMESAVRSDTFTYFSGNLGLAHAGWISTYTQFAQSAVPAPAVPSSAVALNSTSTGGSPIYIPASSTKQLWLTEMEIAGAGGGSGTRFSFVLYDRLSHTGGLVGNVTTEQTTNLPTAALPRYTDGKDVLAFLEVYTAISTVNTTATIKYTNQDGVANRVSKPIVVATNNNSNAGSFTAFPLQNGDTGVRSVESFTMAGVSVAAGNMGITLCKKVAHLPVDTGSYVERQAYRQTWSYGGIVEILPGACLFLSFMASAIATTAWNIQGRLGISPK